MFGMPDQGGGDFLPITNFHGKDGYWQRRENGAMVAMDEWAAIVDFANIEVGWINFSDGAPVFLLTRYGEPPVPDPEPGVPHRDRKFNQGFKATVVLPDGLGPHEFSSNAKGTCGEVYKMLLQYGSSEEAKAGKLPVVKCVGIEKRKSGKHSNPVPIWKLHRGSTALRRWMRRRHLHRLPLRLLRRLRRRPPDPHLSRPRRPSRRAGL